MFDRLSKDRIVLRYGENGMRRSVFISELERLSKAFVYLVVFCFCKVSIATQINTNAKIDGVSTINIEGEPSTLHPVMAADYYAGLVHGYTFGSLGDRDPNTFDWIPYLAESWTLAADAQSVTVKLRAGLVFHDGKPITSEDVKYSFEAVNEPSFMAAHKKPYTEAISSIEIISPLELKFSFKDKYYRNLGVVLGQFIIPKHIYSDLSRTKKLAREIVGSGPYKLSEFAKGQRVVLSRVMDWKLNDVLAFKGAYNFKTLIMRFSNDKKVSLEMVKKGELDYDSLKPDSYFLETEGPMWGKSVFKVKAENLSAKGLSFLGWNQRRILFQDKKVRLALYHLFHREEMNKKFRYGQSAYATGPIYLGSEYADPKLKPIMFDRDEAKRLLSEAGWEDNDKDGIREKKIDGKTVEFRFSVIFTNPEWEKYLTQYAQELKTNGIEMKLVKLEWSSLTKSIDSGDFDAVIMGWSSVVDIDLKQVWHSSSIGGGGSNFVAYKNAEADKLIDESRNEVDKKKRIQKFQKLSRIIAEDYPYIFLYNDRYSFYAYSNKVERPGDTFNYTVGVDYWWSKLTQ